MTRAVFFDVDGVLMHGYHARPEPALQWYANLLADFGIAPERFKQEFIFDVFIKKVLIGKMPLVEALDRRLPSLGFKGSPMVFVDYWLTQENEVDVQLLDLIRKLKQRDDLRLYLATNQDHMRALWLWQNIGLSELFEDMFYSARVGIRKPERGFFDFIEYRIGPQTEPPLFFDDTPKVVEGARTAGWEAVLFNTIDDFTSHPWIAERLDTSL